MQIPPIDRTPSQRSTSANAVSIVAARVNPVAQVSQTVHATPTPAPAPTPSVINMVNMANVERAVSAGLATNLPEPVNPPNVPGALSPVSELKASKESAKPDAASLQNGPMRPILPTSRMQVKGPSQVFLIPQGAAQKQPPAKKTGPFTGPSPKKWKIRRQCRCPKY
ncbi:MAG: hypothetical protein IPH54_11500 [Rhodoferax sp.]|nr:hypothetical protein [Rhodoferax sp.]